MTGRAILTKTTYMATRHCPTKLYYQMNPSSFVNSQSSDSFLQELGAVGHLVGKLGRLHYRSRLLRGLLPPSSSVRFEVEASCLERGHLPRMHCRIDILVTSPLPSGGTAHKLIEVKRKIFDSRLAAAEQFLDKRGTKLLTSFEPLITDVSFQKHVYVQSLGGELPPSDTLECYLLLPDRSKMSPPGINPYRLLNSCNEEDVEESTPLPFLDLLTLVDVSKYVDSLLPSLISPSSPLSLLGRQLPNYGSPPPLSLRFPPALSALCSSCQYRDDANPAKSGLHSCWSSVAKLSDELISGRRTIIDAHGFRGKDRLIEMGIYKLDDVKPEHLVTKTQSKARPKLEDELSSSSRLLLQISNAASRLAPMYLRATMSKWKYPLHFIDFETSLPVVPYFPNMHPSQVVAFQFSHHTLSSDGTVRHAGSFLDVSSTSCPNSRFARSLMTQLEKDGGTVFMWSAHERTVLKAISLELRSGLLPSSESSDAEHIAKFIDTLTDESGERQLVDLKTVADRGYWCRESHGSSSLKKLLPPTFLRSTFLREKYRIANPADNRELKYEDLLELVVPAVASASSSPESVVFRDSEEDGGGDDSHTISDGGAAAMAYARIQAGVDEGEVERISAELLRYCELDTLAMAMIVEAWREELGYEVDRKRTD